MLLKKYELEAQLAKNGKEAVVLHRFDLLLMDKEMPIKDGVNDIDKVKEPESHASGSLVDIEPVYHRGTHDVDEVQENVQNGDLIPEYQDDAANVDGHIDDVVHQEQEVPSQVQVDLPRRDSSTQQRIDSAHYAISCKVHVVKLEEIDETLQVLLDDGEPEDNTEQPDTSTRSPEAITNPQPTTEEESESDTDQDQFLMASQNPFRNFFTSEDCLFLARKIVQGISDFNPTDCAKIALTFALNPSLMDDLTMKDSRRIMELAKLCSEVPWNIPESAVLDPDQSAPPTQALAEPRTTDVVPAAADVAAQSVSCAPAVLPLPRAVIEPGSSAVHAAETSAPTATEVAQRIAVPPLPRATPAAPMPQVSADLPQVHNAAATQPDVHGVHSTAASSDLWFIAPPGSSVSQADASKIPSTKIGVPSILISDKNVLSSGSLNYQVPSSFSLCSKSESKVLFPFPSSKSHDIIFGSFSQPMSNESASDLASSEKLVSNVIKSHDVSLVTKLPTTDLSLDSIRVSILEIQSVPLVSVPFSAPDQCNPVASRTRKGKAKLANSVIPVAPSVKRKLIMDSVSDVEPPRKSRKSVSTRQLRGKVSVPHSLPKSSSSSFPLPILLNKELQAAWLINKDRSLLLQRDIDVENFTACYNLIDLLRSQNLLQTVTNIGPYCDLVTREFYSNLTEATVDRDSDHFHNVYIRRHWYDFSSAPKRDTKKPGKSGDLESSFLPSSFAILLRLATTNWLPTVTVHSVSKKMVVLLFKIRNNIPFNLGELIFDHIMAFRHGQGKEDKVLLPFSSLIYGILCKQGFRKHPQEEELFPTSTYSIDRSLFFKSHLDDCSTFKSAVVPEGESVSSTRSRVSVDFAAVSARVLTTQSILKSLKSIVVQMEKVFLEDKKLLQSFETNDEDLDSAPAR
nr:uncharacterized protein LOC109181161 [Ipomoea batatas]